MSLRKACQGYSRSQGGLNQSELAALVKKLRPKVKGDVLTMPRKRLQKYLCGICVGMDFSEKTNVLKDITIVSNSIMYEGRPINPIDRVELGSGKFGSVSKLVFNAESRRRSAQDKGPIYELAIKESNGEPLDEFNVLRMYPQIYECDNIIPMTIIDEDTLLMPLSTGDLVLLTGLLSEHQADQITTRVRSILDCLETKGIYYLDNKLDNVLFTCYSLKDIQIYLGDLGSVMSDEGYYVSTYPPPGLHDQGWISRETIDKTGISRIYDYQLSLVYAELVLTLSGQLPDANHNDMASKARLHRIIQQLEALPGKTRISDKYIAILRNATTRGFSA